MTTDDRIALGIVGACRRGASFKAACEALEGVRIMAVCDTNKDGLPAAKERLGAERAYTDYETMLTRADLDAVIIATPMPFHAPQSIMALERGLHVLSEVTAAVSLDECRALVRACKASGCVYMMAENYTYRKTNVLVRELARQGLFGKPVYAEGEYLHELKRLNEETPWRRRWQTGIKGITYGTHSLGPILQWMPGDRVARVCCETSDSHYRDPRGEPYAQDTAVMLCKTVKGALIKIRVDMISDRPHAMTNYQFQGTDGVYESSRGGPVDQGKIWFRGLSEEITWHDIESLTRVDCLADKYLPPMWRHPPVAAQHAGHGGGDYFEVLDWVSAIRGEKPCPIGIHEAMDMTLPGLLSQQSVLEGGRWLVVPDSRLW